MLFWNTASKKFLLKAFLNFQVAFFLLFSSKFTIVIIWHAFQQPFPGHSNFTSFCKNFARRLKYTLLHWFYEIKHMICYLSFGPHLTGHLTGRYVMHSYPWCPVIINTKIFIAWFTFRLETISFSDFERFTKSLELVSKWCSQ